MRREIATAATFIADTFLGQPSSSGMKEQFTERLTHVLTVRYSSHWHPQRPWQGNAYRALCWGKGGSHCQDSSLKAAAAACGLDLCRLLPDLVVWVDPQEVAAKIGEHGSVFEIEIVQR